LGGRSGQFAMCIVLLEHLRPYLVAFGLAWTGRNASDGTRTSCEHT